MKTKYKEIVTQEGQKAVSFDIETSKGQAHGIFKNDKIWVHGISGKGSVKGIMDVLVNKFKTNKAVFTPLINDNIKNVIDGEVKVLKADDIRNPYKEDMEYLECEWRR